MLIERSKSVAQQVETLLRGKITSGEYPPGSRMPSESELAASFGVSRATVRTALTALEAARLIVRKQGDGTYISKYGMEISACLGDEWDFQHMIVSSGRACRIESVSVEMRPALPDELQALDIDKGEQVLAIQRIFFADDQPVIFSNNIIPARYLAKSGPYDVLQPIRQILRQYCNQEIAYSISDISACLPEGALVQALRLASGKPVLRFVDIFYTSRNYPIVYGVNFYNDKALRMRVTRAWSQSGVE